MDNWPQGPRWALVYGGNSYIIYLVLPVLVGSTRRCTLISSGVLYIDDVNCPFPAILLFMVLSAQMTHEDLAATLSIELPLGSKIVSPDATNEADQSEVVSRPGIFPCTCMQ
jgi:hypothetical protein